MLIAWLVFEETKVVVKEGEVDVVVGQRGGQGWMKVADDEKDGLILLRF
jgi:hypothetical protein